MGQVAHAHVRHNGRRSVGTTLLLFFLWQEECIVNYVREVQTRFITKSRGCYLRDMRVDFKQFVDWSEGLKTPRGNNKGMKAKNVTSCDNVSARRQHTPL